MGAVPLVLISPPPIATITYRMCTSYANANTFLTSAAVIHPARSFLIREGWLRDFARGCSWRGRSRAYSRRIRTELCEFWNSRIAFQWSEIRKPKDSCWIYHPARPWRSPPRGRFTSSARIPAIHTPVPGAASVPSRRGRSAQRSSQRQTGKDTPWRPEPWPCAHWRGPSRDSCRG